MKCFLKKTGKKMKQISTALILTISSISAHANTTGQHPWEKVLNEIWTSLSGPVAYSIAGIAIVVTGLMMAFSDLQGGAKKAMQVALGLSIAFGAATIISSFFSFSGAVL
jgi:type IV secretory pathway VirB2 component (pilin)